MFYDWIKILHVISAALFFTGTLNIFLYWVYVNKSGNISRIGHASQRILLLGWLMILPAGLFQLLSGFTMLSLKHFLLAERWVQASLGGFVIVILCWFSLLYLITGSQTLLSNISQEGLLSSDFLRTRNRQYCLFALILLTILVMIFFMANKIA